MRGKQNLLTENEQAEHVVMRMVWLCGGTGSNVCVCVCAPRMFFAAAA